MSDYIFFLNNETDVPYIWANYFAHYPISFFGMVKMVWKIVSLMFGQIILPIRSHFLGWSNCLENSLKNEYNGLTLFENGLKLTLMVLLWVLLVTLVVVVFFEHVEVL